MFAAVGIAGLYVLQAASSGRRPRPERAGDKTVAGGQQGLPCDRPSSPAKLRPQNLSQIMKHGSVVCFKDKHNQTAVVQPCGTGRCTWQLAVTCASGGCVSLSHGQVYMSYVAADALFLVCQVDNSNTFAFRSLGAEGRFLAAHRDLSQPPFIEQHRITPASQWRITGSGLTNVQHSHKKLPFSVHGVKAMPLDAIAAADHSYEAMLGRQHSQFAAVEDFSRSLERNLQEARGQLVTDRREHAEQVERLTHELSRWKQRGKELDADVRQQQKVVVQLQQAVQELQLTCGKSDQELDTAYQEIAQLQQQLADQQQVQQQQLHHMQQAFNRELAEREALLRNHAAEEARQWAEVRQALEASLHHKDEDITTLSAQVQRLDHALKEVQRLMCGNSRKQRLDRASLDAVSIHQLQAAVAQFAAQGECMLDSPSSTLRESQALQKLLASQVSDGSNVSAQSEEPEDAPHHQQQQQQHRLHHNLQHAQQRLQATARAHYNSSSIYAQDTMSCPVDQLPAGGSCVGGGSLADTCDLHDSPLVKLAQVAASCSGSLMRGSSNSSSRAGSLAALGSRASGMKKVRVAASTHPSEASSAGASWLAAAAAAADCNDANSWPAAGAPGRHHLATGSGGGSCVGSAAGGTEQLPGSSWGINDVGVSGSSRRTNTSVTSEEHGTHRYSCSENLSDADSSSQAGDEAAEEECEADELEAIHSVGCSLEEGLLKHHLSISRQLQPQLDEASPASPEAAGSKQQLSGRNVLSSTSLAPVKEEHP